MTCWPDRRPLRCSACPCRCGTAARRTRPSASTWCVGAESSTGPATSCETTPSPPAAAQAAAAGAGLPAPGTSCPRVAQLPDAHPALTAAAVTDRLGVHHSTAQAALTPCRAERMADAMEQRALTAAQAAAALDYLASQTRRASVRAEASSADARPAPTSPRSYRPCTPAAGTPPTPRPPSTTPKTASASPPLSWTPPRRRPPPWCGSSATVGAPPVPVGTHWARAQHGPAGDGVRHLAGTIPDPADLVNALDSTS